MGKKRRLANFFHWTELEGYRAGELWASSRIRNPCLTSNHSENTGWLRKMFSVSQNLNKNQKDLFLPPTETLITSDLRKVTKPH